ncbi:MAG: MaoC family dehydratase [Pseudomonadota bacterium]
MPTTISTEELAALPGRELAASEWLEITQERVNQFADATNDHQFIHIDEALAKATPFGGTIAHGFLSLSLITHLIADTMPVPEGCQMTINYGSDKVRYLTPVRVGKRIRAQQTVLEAAEKQPGRWLVKTAVTIEIENEETPAVIAEILFMHFAA